MSRAQDKRIWLAGGAALAVLIIAVGWLAVISPQRSSTNSLRGEADSARTQNAVLATKVANLKRQNDGVAELRTTLRTALAALPFDTGLPAFTRQLSSQASQHNIKLTSIAVGAITPVAVAAAAVPTTTAGTTTASTTTAGTAAVAAAPMQIPLTLTSTGTGKNQLAFLRAIQVTGPRRALVESTTVSTAGTGTGTSIDKASTMTTQLNVFSTPLSAAAQTQLEKLLSGK